MSGSTDKHVLDSLQSLQAALERLNGALREQGNSLSALHSALIARSRSVPANDA